MAASKKTPLPTSMKARMDRKRLMTDIFADAMTVFFGSNFFLASNFLIFLFWILINLGLIPFIPVFDPYPFGFLTMAVSLEAIFLSIFVLISQNRAAKIADIREEIDLQINIQAEQEISRLILMVDEVHAAMGLKNSDDKKVKRMEKATNLRKLEEKIAREME